MNILDEQMRADQRGLLKSWRIPFRQIGRETGARGMDDGLILPLLLTLKHPTFFTHDQGFFSPDLRHDRYCLVWLNAKDTDAAHYIRMFLRHRRFNTQRKRLGLVLRVHTNGIHWWSAASNRLLKTGWDD